MYWKLILIFPYLSYYDQIWPNSGLNLTCVDKTVGRISRYEMRFHGAAHITQVSGEISLAEYPNKSSTSTHVTSALRRFNPGDRVVPNRGTFSKFGLDLFNLHVSSYSYLAIIVQMVAKATEQGCHIWHQNSVRWEKGNKKVSLSVYPIPRLLINFFFFKSSLETHRQQTIYFHHFCCCICIIQYIFSIRV